MVPLGRFVLETSIREFGELRPDLERPDAGMDAQVPIDAAPPPEKAE